MAFVRTLDGPRITVTQSRKRGRAKPRSILDPSFRIRRAILITLALKHDFETADLAAWLGISRRHVQREAALVSRVARKIGVTDAE